MVLPFAAISAYGCWTGASCGTSDGPAPRFLVLGACGIAWEDEVDEVEGTDKWND